MVRYFCQVSISLVVGVRLLCPTDPMMPRTSASRLQALRVSAENRPSVLAFLRPSTRPWSGLVRPGSPKVADYLCAKPFVV